MSCSGVRRNDGAASNLTQQVDTANGSTSTTTYTVDADNAATSATTNGILQDFSYDGDGNLTSWTGGWGVTYNAQNQMTSIQDGGESESYSYSGPTQQEMLSVTNSALTLQVANSALGETYQQGSDSSATGAYARDNRGALVSKSPQAGVYDYYLFDGLGSVVALTDGTGAVANRYSYDPYGNLASSSTTLYNPFQYASGWVSGITLFSHFGQRWYAPTPSYGRWTQQDPVAGSLSNPTSQCRYAYAHDDPVNEVDPSGAITMPSSECGWAIAGALFDVIATAAFAEAAITFSLGLAAIGLSAALVANHSPLSLGIGLAGIGGSIVAAAFGATPVGFAIDAASLILSCAGDIQRAAAA